MGKLKVLQVAPLGTGGVTSLILNIADKLEDDIVFDFLTFYDRKEFREDLALSYGGKKYVVPIDHYKNPVVRALFKFFYTIKVVRECNPDVMHLNISKPYDVLVGVSARLAGVKKVYVHSHNSKMLNVSGFKGCVMKMLKEIIPLVSDKNLACSELAAEFMFPKRVLESKDYILIKNAVDVNKFRFNSDVREEYRSKLGLTDNFVIGHIGRFNEQKNHKFLIDIFESVLKIDSSARLLLIGTGDLVDEVKKKVSDKGLDDKVIFYGTSSEIECLVQAMDCFLMPSLYEGLPLVGVEAQASGLPLVLSDTITEELDVTPNVRWFSLSMSADEWANGVKGSKVSNDIRKEMYKDVIKAGFDVVDTKDILTKLYKEGLVK